MALRAIVGRVGHEATPRTAHHVLPGETLPPAGKVTHLRDDIPVLLSGGIVPNFGNNSMMLTPFSRSGRLQFIQWARDDGLYSGCTVVKRGRLDAVGGNSKDLTLSDMGIMTWNLYEIDRGDWRCCRVEWMTTPIKVTYEAATNLVAVEE